MKYNHRFLVRAPLSAVTAFHRQSASMAAITPPPIQVKVHKSPAELSDGDEMDFSLGLGPFQIRWLASIEGVTEAGFVDRQIQGPFQEWTHRHTFLPIDPTLTEVDDLVIAQTRSSFGGRLIGWGMWLGMPVLFAYRGWKTSSILEK